MTNDIGERVISVEALSTNAENTRYEPLDPLKTYRILISSYQVGGGDGYNVIPQYMQNHQ